MKTTCRNGFVIETWYDRKARTYVTQTLNLDSNPIGDSDFAGTKEWSLLNHQDAVKTQGGPRRVLKLSGIMRVIPIVNGECEVQE